MRVGPRIIARRYTYTEVQRHKAGRKARIGGLVERLAGPAPEGDDLSSI